MESVNFKNAYYIKLGRKGEWEESSIKESKIRIGWRNQTIEDINQGNWDIIKIQLEKETENPDPGAITRDLKALKLICETNVEEDIWTTFYSSKLWWCRAGEPGIYEDATSKFREVKGEWKDCDTAGNPLIINQISGRLSKLQGFRGTICRIKEIDDLKRLLNNQTSSEYQAINATKKLLISEIERGLKKLHWKDFETLIDLIFRNAGWRRLSLLGETMKYVDMELEEPITGDLYQVQVKSSAAVSDFENYLEQFSAINFRKLYFVVHSPTDDLINYQPSFEKNVELILPNRLAGMVVELGLIDWLMKKIR